MTPPAQNALRVRCDPVLGKVRDRLLAIGGTDVVLGTAAPSAVRRLYAAGRLFARAGAVTIPLDSRASATNVARLYALCPGDLDAVSGYALGRDGCWRPHAWALLDETTVIETTSRRDGYFGYLLDPAEAARFCWQEPAPPDAPPLPDNLPATIYAGRVRRTLEYGEQLLKMRN
jgi:hypothetical protein